MVAMVATLVVTVASPSLRPSELHQQQSLAVLRVSWTILRPLALQRLLMRQAQVRLCRLVQSLSQPTAQAPSLLQPVLFLQVAAVYLTLQLLSVTLSLPEPTVVTVYTPVVAAPSCSQ